MEFNEKLQQLRKDKNLTQEQLAEELFVSRTAVSKWESGRGYPNIDSLKNISKVFSVSLDNLLSSEELISIAETENHNNINKFLELIFGILDSMTISFLFLPLYGEQYGDSIRSVNLFSLYSISCITRFIYFTLPSVIAILGIAELIMQYYDNNKYFDFIKTCSISLHTITILIFILTRQPYPSSLLFMFFMVKIIFIIKYKSIK